MNKKIISDGVLVYDRFYGAKPLVPFQVLKKILLCCAVAVFGMLFILTEYEMPVSLPLAAGVTAGACALFTLLFVFVKRRFAVPSMLFVAGAVVYFNIEKLTEPLSYFADAAMLLVDGRFLHPKGLLLHEEALLDVSNPDYVRGVTLGFLTLCVLYALVVSCAFAKRPRTVPVLAVFVLLCVPRLLSETLEFNLWLVPYIAFIAAAAAIEICYRSGLAVKGVGSDYRKAVSAEERSFRINTAHADYPKRVEMNAIHYSKYFSVGIYCAVVFTITTVLASVVFEKGSSIDYSKAYNLIASIGDESGITASPFEDGPVSEYFTHPKNHNSSNTLNVVSPGTGEQDIIRVSVTGTSPVYLRGDIGIDFTGTAWTSPVNDEPAAWRDSGLAAVYRPCEGRVIHSLLEATGTTEGYIASSDVTIDYLCETSVVFLPPYTAEYSFYDNELFNVYGDFAVRVNEDFGVVNTVQCTAVIPAYTDTDKNFRGISVLSEVLDAFDKSWCSVSSIYTTVVPEMADNSGYNVIDEYEAFVEETYMTLPDKYEEFCSGFLSESGLVGQLPLESDYLGGEAEASLRYKTASVIADYLRSNYTYSLTAQNDPSAPVVSFLNTTKSGHCSLYASSMTLLLRSLNIPARYCTGFMVDPAEGAVQTLKAKNLHAWCEVYLGELGWATFDPTSSSVYLQQKPKPEQAEETAEHTTPAVTHKPQTTAATSATHVGQPTADETAETTERQGLDLSALKPYIITVGILLVLAAAAVLIGYSLHRLKRAAEKRFVLLSKGASETEAAEIYGLILSIVAVYGVSPSKGEMPGAFYKRVDALFGSSLKEHTALLEELAFGSCRADAAQRDVLLSQLKQVYRSAVSWNAPIKRIKVQKILAGK